MIARKIYLYNTKTRSSELFTPQETNRNNVYVYTCGPTLYKPQHIGNYRSYIFADTLRRTLTYFGFNVKYAINLTDVGHLVSDGDDGDDKIELEANRKKITTSDLIKTEKQNFFDDLSSLNIDIKKYIFPAATEYIDEQIEIIKKLEANDYTYKISDGIYFDTSKFPNYGDMLNFKNLNQMEGARVEKNHEKRNPSDFALWKFSEKNTNRQQEWESPWGVGFPGWHIECSAMAMSVLSTTIDIHTGGIDNLSPHHINEIAQSESATGKEFSRFWMHIEHMMLNGSKISKSLGNVVTIDDLISKHYSPIALRYLMLTMKYSSHSSFTYDSLNAAEISLSKLNNIVKMGGFTMFTQTDKKTIEKIEDHMSNDLNTPQAIAEIWNMVRNTDISIKQKSATIKYVDKFFGLDFGNNHNAEIPESIKKLVNAREKLRNDKDWDSSDKIREEIKSKGWWVEDTDNEPIIVPYREFNTKK